MRLRENAAVKDRYDVVVIGAGIGGLTAGGLLAKKGLKVLVLEQHYIPGGCCSAFRRNGVALDVGAAMLFGFGEKGYAPHRFVMNELEEEIDMIPHDSLYRLHLSKSKSVTFWRDMDRFLDEIGGLFPHQDKQVRALYDEFMEFFKGMVLTNEGVPVPPTEVAPKEGLKTIKHPDFMCSLPYRNASKLTLLFAGPVFSYVFYCCGGVLFPSCVFLLLQMVLFSNGALV